MFFLNYSKGTPDFAPSYHKISLPCSNQHSHTHGENRYGYTNYQEEHFLGWLNFICIFFSWASKGKFFIIIKNPPHPYQRDPRLRHTDTEYQEPRGRPDPHAYDTSKYSSHQDSHYANKAFNKSSHRNDHYEGQQYGNEANYGHNQYDRPNQNYGQEQTNNFTQEPQKPKFIERKDYPEEKLIIFASTIWVGGIPKNFFGVESRLRGIFEKRGKVSKVTHVKAKGVAYVEFAEFKDPVHLTIYPIILEPLSLGWNEWKKILYQNIPFSLRISDLLCAFLFVL